MTDAAPVADEAAGVDPPSTQRGMGPTLQRCAKCSMRVRRDEVDIHLAHAHNIGPATGRKDKGGRDRGRQSR